MRRYIERAPLSRSGTFGLPGNRACLSPIANDRAIPGARAPAQRAVHPVSADIATPSPEDGPHRGPRTKPGANAGTSEHAEACLGFQRKRAGCVVRSRTTARSALLTGQVEAVLLFVCRDVADLLVDLGLAVGGSAAGALGIYRRA